jgi:large subunit ribosomal protein L15
MTDKPKKKAAPKKTAAPSARAAKASAPRKEAAPVVHPGGPATGVHHLAPAAGATHARKRVGRGPGSGHGKTAGRGHKGQKSRSGYRHMRGFEGGQMPLHRRLPKRGFTNVFRREYDPVNLKLLASFEAGQEISPETLHAFGFTGKNALVKILGDGEVSRALTVRAHKFSASARAKIEKAGGRCEVIETEKVAS